MESEEITKLVDGIYKNILEKFNPGARQLINAGKAYLKALHGAAAASRLYLEAITRLARQAQQGTWGGSSDVGTALMQIVEVYKEIQAQQMNILKAFYVDLLVPLETNLEKDTKVVQSEQKRFLQQHKARFETYSKAANTMKKQRKKNRGTKTGLAMDKELKTMQTLEEEKCKLDGFCEQSLKNAITQERRRYGFVLERQCSLAKHYLAYHSLGSAALQRGMDEWREVARTREFLPEAVDTMFCNRMRQVTFWPEEDIYTQPRNSASAEDLEERMSLSSQLRKTKSMDASCLDIRAIGDLAPTSPMSGGASSLLPLTRAKSEFNLTASNSSLVQELENHHSQRQAARPKSLAAPSESATTPITTAVASTPGGSSGGGSSAGAGSFCQLARALYAYLSSGENQLSFLEGDIIALMGERNKGWQFGENMRTQRSGWFPLAYTELMAPGTDEDESTLGSPGHQRHLSLDTTGGASSLGSAGKSPSGPTTASAGSAAVGSRPVSLFGDPSRAPKIRPTGVPAFSSGTRGGEAGVPPPAPTVTAPRPGDAPTSAAPRRPQPPPPPPPLQLHLQTRGADPASARHSGGGAPGNASLHSSNDSGFSNEPPPQPEADYSDDEGPRSLSGGESCCDGIGDHQTAAHNGPHHDRRNPRISNTSDVKGWLLYKSALELWDDVERGNQTDETLHASYATLNRLPMHTPTECTVKRTKSLWRFGLGRKNSVQVLEGMSLWRHRSLVDLPAETITTSPPPVPAAQRPSRSARPLEPPPPPPPRDETCMTAVRENLPRRANSTAKLPKIDETKSRHFKSLQRFHKKSDRGSSNNLYGPWYDLWGKDASVVDGRV